MAALLVEKNRKCRPVVVVAALLVEKIFDVASYR
jgi:hypothetical protein